MKQMESVGNERRSNSGKAAAAGVFRAPQAAAGVAGGWTNDAPMVQRTFGNAAAAKLAGEKAATPGLSAQVFSQILERGLRDSAGKDSTGKDSAGQSNQKGGNGVRHTSGTHGVIQRWSMAEPFNQYTTGAFGFTVPAPFYFQVLEQLKIFDSMPQAQPQEDSPPEVTKQAGEDWAKRRPVLRALYTLCDKWAMQPENEPSPGFGVIKWLMGVMRDILSPQQQPQEAKEDKAGTALGKTSNVSVDYTAKLSPEQVQAIEVINKTSLHPARKAHARDMIRNPDMIEQGAFGVCGLTSILFAVCKANPVRFGEMIRDAWADDELVTKWMEVFYNNADPRHIELRSEVEYVTAQWVVRKSQGEKGQSTSLDQEKLDHWTRRESEKTKDQQYKDVFARQKKFSDSFELDGWENTLGHFALTAGAISQLLNGLGTGKPSYKIKRKNMEQDLEMAMRKKGSNGSVLASVTNTQFYQSNEDVTTDFTRKDGTKGGTKPSKEPKPEGDTTPKAPPKYVHWVVLKDAKLGTDGFYDLDIWTWRSNYKARVRKDVIYSHIYSLMVVQSKVW